MPIINPDISTYNEAQEPGTRDVCDLLAALLNQHLPEATSKVWHGAPVWFLNENPVTGYAVRKSGVQVLFWSGQSFDEPGLTAEGSFKAAEAVYTSVADINEADLARWLGKARTIQWDYKNIVKRRGVLERLV